MFKSLLVALALLAPAALADNTRLGHKNSKVHRRHTSCRDSLNDHNHLTMPPPFRAQGCDGLREFHDTFEEEIHKIYQDAAGSVDLCDVDAADEANFFAKTSSYFFFAGEAEGEKDIYKFLFDSCEITRELIPDNSVVDSIQDTIEFSCYSDGSAGSMWGTLHNTFLVNGVIAQDYDSRFSYSMAKDKEGEWKIMNLHTSL